ncbi:MAG: hypothetical protein SAJ12_17265 [Jaaginema sp. PMC 1079.18]|nr:hypothetical protein [Jaaginema sp. PMC 1080.18]MEC4852733.1 hypothetical protein [Jaaginema sp. PMC 1079.18]MEC4866793.1 hypothetical protein [Jaaginema sp. PMC 1078.18]
MEIIQQTDTRLEIRHRPILQYFVSLMMAGFSIYSIIQFNAYFGWTAFWFLVLLGSIYAFFVWHKIIHCFADTKTQTLHIRKRNLVKTETRQQYFFSEVSSIEVREKRNKNGRYYLAFLMLKSGEAIYIGRGNKLNLENSLRLFAKAIDCYYNFVPRQSFWNIF